jgi:diguanylate cyclase (GGDEF)-like protein
MDTLTEQLEEAAEGSASDPTHMRASGLAELDQSVGKVIERLREERARADEARQESEQSAVQLGEVLQSTLDLSRILNLVLDVVAQRLDATQGAIWVFNSTRDRLEAQAALATLPLAELREQDLRVGEGLAGWVAVTGEPGVIPSLSGPRAASPEPEVETALAVPILVRNKTYAVLALYGRAEGMFHPTDVDSVWQFVTRAGVGIENVIRHQEAQRRSITDGLTGVWNRRYFEMRMREELERSVRHSHAFSVLMVDLDNFKEVNDRFGHRSGDEVLVEVARRMTESTRELDTCARYGGEEFVLLLPETDSEGARFAANKLRRAISSKPIRVTDVGDLAVTVSVGVASYPEHGNLLAEVMEKADNALYSAKRTGKNRVVVAGDPFEEVAGVS